MVTLNVNEIFFTIQGESTRAGLPCVMVRLSGCNLDCTWCDTVYAREEPPTEMSIDAILEAAAAHPIKRVEITGGEPMLQAGAPELMQRFIDSGYEVLLETNGSIELAMVPMGVKKIVDVKCPASGEADSLLSGNLIRLDKIDEVKFILASREDYDYARNVIHQQSLIGRAEVILSPCAGQLDPATLAQWILEDGLDVRLGLQLHKLIWPA
ncbi:MAG: radical SAM protein, partial [Phycisphaerales bacterium]|nr:radical SAM protein [Phycisphaerales bacterium]